MSTYAGIELRPDELKMLTVRPRPTGLAAIREHVEESIHWYLSVAVFVAFMGVWQFISANKIVHEIILPTPLSVIQAFDHVVGRELFLVHFGYTLYEIFVGFAIGVALGLGLGILFALSDRARKILYPYVVGFQASPRVVFAPLMLAWFGFGTESKIGQAVIGSFFPVFLNTLVGLALVEPNAVKLMASLRASRWQTFRVLRFPNALPAIFAGVKVSLTFATIGAIVAEFIGSEYGLGYEVQRYHLEISIPEMYDMIIIVGALGLAIYLAIEWVDKVVVFWRKDAADWRKLK